MVQTKIREKFCHAVWVMGLLVAVCSFLICGLALLFRDFALGKAAFVYGTLFCFSGVAMFGLGILLLMVTVGPRVASDSAKDCPRRPPPPDLYGPRPPL